jgi:hypothetical protein
LSNQDKKETVASNKINENKEAEINTNTVTVRKTGITANNLSGGPDQNKIDDQSISQVTSTPKKDTAEELAQKSVQPDKNSEKQKINNTASTNIQTEQKKDVVVTNKQKEPGSNNGAKQVVPVNNNNSGDPNQNKPKNEKALSQVKPVLKKDTTMQVTQKIAQPADKNSEQQKMVSTVSTSTPVTQKKDLIAGNKELPVIVANRTNENMQDVYFKNDSLVLSLYDNGIVDGDTVSVFLNGEPIVSKQMLKASATKKTIYISPEMDSVQLVLFAENLGTIPPNTGLLTVRDGDDIYQVRFSADLQKNASIILRRKKE